MGSKKFFGPSSSSSAPPSIPPAPPPPPPLAAMALLKLTKDWGYGGAGTLPSSSRTWLWLIVSDITGSSILLFLDLLLPFLDFLGISEYDNYEGLLLLELFYSVRILIPSWVYAKSCVVRASLWLLLFLPLALFCYSTLTPLNIPESTLFTLIYGV